MRIAHYYPYTFAGIQGVANAVRGMGTAQSRQGADVTFFVDDSIPQGVAPQPGQKVIGLQHALRGRARVPVEVSPITRGDFDIVCVYSAWVPGKAIAAFLAHHGGAKVVVSPQGGLHPRLMQRHQHRKKPYWVALERPHLRRADAIHVLFLEEVADLECLGLRTAVIVAPNGVNVRDGTSWDGDTASGLVWIGRYDIEHKGLDLLVQAIHALPAGDRPKLRLFGPEFRQGQTRLTRIIEHLRLEPWVTVNGPIYGDEKREVLTTAGCFVYPSRWEAGGIAALEAMSYGLPAILTEYPLGRYMKERRAAFVAAAEPMALAEQIHRVLATDAREIAARGSTIVREEFNWDTIAQNWLTQARDLP